MYTLKAGKCGERQRVAANNALMSEKNEDVAETLDPLRCPTG